MLIRKHSLFLPALSNFTTTFNASSTSPLKRKRETARPCLYCQTASRTYATIASDSSDPPRPPPAPGHAWPTAPDGQKHPTPYQIFQIPHNATYTKARFYQLVKLYHPDRSHHASSIPTHIKMERYRLIVAANDILSDPTKRSAYDRFGAGWNGKAGLRRHDNGESAGPFSQNWTGGSDPSDPIWRNATWEDWERFYRARAGHQEGVHQPNRNGLYASNSYFLLMVMVLALLGSSANFSRAQSEGHYLVEQRDVVHDKTAKELRKVRQEALGSGSKQDRVEWFLRNREATMGLPGVDVETLREEKVDRLLPRREICRSESVVEKE